jgi:hypothetical protein
MPNGPYVLRSPPNLFDKHRKEENFRDSKQAKFGEFLTPEVSNFREHNF